jgi:hypothetical protein
LLSATRFQAKSLEKRFPPENDLAVVGLMAATTCADICCAHNDKRTWNGEMYGTRTYDINRAV